MTRAYRYILTHDSGMAPCPDGGLISLATCKPVIRRVARPGDWVLGFRPGSLERGLMLWAGRVAEKMSHGEYQRQHGNRSDAVYRMGKNGDYERLDPAYHPSQAEMDRDVREPVLLFDKAVSVYLGGQPASLPDTLAQLAAAGRGHRVSEVAPDELAALERWIGALTPAPSVRGRGRRQSCR
ncbi:hypothetical protein GRI62_10650 [Erythrobacter arachoides]|uniref:Nucleotide modification associated domain-containing protein n=1 Tax=Aurantiacibacter arachoides TaxID=1850444 RepID=A0A845A365_9SPHN|nr:hypothetical protein [Aurantiacibacter arachoides]MXO94060.1 hypothetical protein [Aurantiacibacter arachoides]GGD44387.1 hypothetical protein GCM10011411_00070 [Aurantiacibacter arachoides]